MRFITKVRNNAYARGVEHGRTIGIQAVEAFIHSEIRLLQSIPKQDKNTEYRLKELIYVLFKIKGMYAK